VLKGNSIEIYNGELAFGFMDIHPRTKGQCLIIPKRHVAELKDLENKEIEEIFSAAKKICASIKESLGANGFSIIINLGPVAGQNVEHLALQIFPRYKNEETAGVPPGAIFKTLGSEIGEIKEIGNKIKAEIEIANKEKKEDTKRVEKVKNTLDVKRSKRVVEFV
jgi:histidine triad (HIT) family protein